MNDYEEAREWLESQIVWRLKALREIENNAEYGDPGIYYEQLAEASQLNREIEDITRKLQELHEAL